MLMAQPAHNNTEDTHSSLCWNLPHISHVEFVVDEVYMLCKNKNIYKRDHNLSEDVEMYIVQSIRSIWYLFGILVIAWEVAVLVLMFVGCRCNLVGSLL